MEQEDTVDFSDNKIEIAIVGFAAVLVVGAGYLLKSPVQSILEETNQVSYEMPRPKTSFFAALFGLGDREIDRKYVNPFVKKTGKDDKKNAAVAAPTGTQVKAPTKTGAPKNAANKMTDISKKNQVDVQIVGDTPTNSMSDSNDFNGGVAPSYVDNGGGGSAAAQKDQRNKLDGNQWRALVMAQPTKENVLKLLEAYQSKEVDDQTFYTIVVDLFKNNKPEVQSYGLYAVKSAVNLKSFTVTAEYYDKLAPEVQTQANSYLLSYSVSGRLPILLSALQSSNPVVVSTAAEVVLEGHKNAKDGTNMNLDPRSSRGNVMANSVSEYVKFIPVFKKLSESQDPAIANLANTALSQIQNPVAAL